MKENFYKFLLEGERKGSFELLLISKGGLQERENNG